MSCPISSNLVIDNGSVGPGLESHVEHAELVHDDHHVADVVPVHVKRVRVRALRQDQSRKQVVGLCTVYKAKLSIGLSE